MKVSATIAGLVLMICAVLAGSSPAATQSLAGSGYSSRYMGESAFTSKVAGETGQLVAIFFNDGTTTWLPGVVGLLVCSSDHEICGTASNTGYQHHWYSASVYATVSAAVPPGQNGFFIYEIAVPQGTPPGVSAVFSGDVGLIASGVMLHPDGYFHVNTTPAGGTARLAAAFRALPIPATDGTATVLGVDLLSPTGERAVTDSTTLLTATRDAADEDVCVVAGTGVAAAVEGHAEFRVQAAGSAGFCHITVTANAGGLRTTATLETRYGGTPTRLTVSGTSSPRPVGAGPPIMVAVDIDDVNVQLVGWDETTSVHLALDATTCAGAAAGDVYAPSGFDLPAVHGRAWFVLRSNGAYPACRGTVTAPGLIGSTFVVTFAPGP